MRRTKDDAEVTRQSLLDAALQVFSHQGYAAARLEDIAERAHVTRGAIYFHYGSKAELFAALVEQASLAGNQAVAQAIQAGGPFLDILRRVLRETLRLLDEDPRFRGAMALMLFNSGDSPELSALRSLRAAQGTVQLDQIGSFFQIGIAQGELRSDLDAKAAAYAFLAYQNGLVTMRILAPGSISPERDADLADLFVRGIAPA